MVKATRFLPILAGLTMGLASGLNAQTAVTDEMIAQGKTLFAGAAGCQMCHGPAGKGTPMTKPLTDGEWAFATDGTFEALVKLITDGLPAGGAVKMPMPAASTKKLSEEQIEALAAYVMSLSKP